MGIWAAEGLDQGSCAPLSRSGLLRRALLATGAVAAGEALHPFAAAAAADRDAQILNFLLQLEYLQEAFYGEAVSRRRLRGDLLRFAQVAAGQERAHVQALVQLLAGAALRPPRFRFGAAASDPARFGPAALELEETAASGYIGQSANLSAASLGRVASIASVDARHAGWLRDLLGQLPAPRAADRGASAGQVQQTIRSTGFVG